jgi:uncharacterized membrane protein
MGENHFANVPAALYGGVLLLCAIAYTILQSRILALLGKDSPVARSIGKDVKGKLSLAGYVVGIVLRSWGTVDRHGHGPVHLAADLSSLLWSPR